MLDLWGNFIDIDAICRLADVDLSPLHILATLCRHSTSFTEKAILLLNRKANISCRNPDGYTVLHRLLVQYRPNKMAGQGTDHWFYKRYRLSLGTCEDLLMVFITAGADVYAADNEGTTPSMVAAVSGHMEVWNESLLRCGYDPVEVLASCPHHPTRLRQTSKLSFQEYCEQRRRWQREQGFDEPENFEDEDETDTDSASDTESDDDDESEYQNNIKCIPCKTCREGGHRQREG